MDRVGQIRDRINACLNPQSLEIKDESHLHAGHPGAASGGGHFAVVVVSDLFNGHPLLERHRMVYRAVADLMPAQIHALSISAMTPQECLPR